MRAVLAMVVATMVGTIASCKKPTLQPGIETSLVTLPNSWTIVARGGRVVALAPDGLPRWTATLPKQDRIATPIAAAADGTVYLRGRTTLHALGADGRWRWHRTVPGLPAKLPGKDAPIYAPVAMTDSTVAMITEELELLAFTSNGDVRWRQEIRGDGPLMAPPRCAPNGQIIVAIPEGVVAISPAGRVDWEAK